MIIFANAPLFNAYTVVTGWRQGTLVSKPGTADEFAVLLPSGRHLSIGPYGAYEDRPAGTFGAYETVRVRGTNLVIQYTFENRFVAHVIPFVGDL